MHKETRNKAADPNRFEAIRVRAASEKTHKIFYQRHTLSSIVQSFKGGPEYRQRANSPPMPSMYSDSKVLTTLSTPPGKPQRMVFPPQTSQYRVTAQFSSPERPKKQPAVVSPSPRLIFSEKKEERPSLRAVLASCSAHPIKSLLHETSYVIHTPKHVFKHRQQSASSRNFTIDFSLAEPQPVKSMSPAVESLRVFLNKTATAGSKEDTRRHGELENPMRVSRDQLMNDSVTRASRIFFGVRAGNQDVDRKPSKEMKKESTSRLMSGTKMKLADKGLNMMTGPHYDLAKKLAAIGE